MRGLVDKIINNFIKQGIIPSEDSEIYAYGLYQGIVIIINILTYILISLYFKMVWESVIFLVCYIPLRTYAGGYHARTQVKCYFLSILMITLVILAIKTVPWTSSIMIGLLLLGGSIIFVLSPVEDSNKPLSDSQKIVFKRIARTILLIELIIGITLLQMGYIMFVLPITLAMVVACIMVVFGRARNGLKKTNY